MTPVTGCVRDRDHHLEGAGTAFAPSHNTSPLLCRDPMPLRAALLMLAIITVTAQTTLPIKGLVPTLVEIKVRNRAASLELCQQYVSRKRVWK